MKIFKTSRPFRYTVLGAIALGLTTALLMTCSKTLEGTPIAGEIDVRNLAVGNYPTEPLDVRANYSHTLDSGKFLAIGRLADAVAIGTDIDPSLTHGVLSQYIPVPSSATRLLSDATMPALDANQMILGYSASVSTHPLIDTTNVYTHGYFNAFGGSDTDPNSSSVNITVLQFPDKQRAQAAADQIEEADFNVAPDLNTRFNLDEYPAAKAHWRPGIPSMAATLAHDQYLINIYVQRPSPELNSLKELATKVFAAQIPLLDRTPALTQRNILRLDYDPYDMQRRVLHPSTGPGPGKDEVTSTPRGYLHTVDDQQAWKKLLDDNGVDRISTASKGCFSAPRS